MNPQEITQDMYETFGFVLPVSFDKNNNIFAIFIEPEYYSQIGIREIQDFVDIGYEFVNMHATDHGYDIIFRSK